MKQENKKNALTPARENSLVPTTNYSSDLTQEQKKILSSRDSPRKLRRTSKKQEKKKSRTIS